MGKRLVHNYPSPKLMEKIGATNQTPAEAIGELVANCFDARYKNDKIEISILFQDSKVYVIDNGKGMTDTVLEKAVCIAEDMSQYIERGEGAKGHFGMGFKTSCATLGNRYEIYTRPVGKDIELYTSFDIAEYGTRPSGAAAWDVFIEDFKPNKRSPLKDMQHGTAFVISELKNKNITVSAVLSYLGDAFKPHLESGDKIVIIDDNNETYYPEPKKYNFIKGTKVEIDESFGPNNKYHITGWMALDSQTHNDGLYGFNIYRKNQLVVTFDKSWFSAHLMTSRLIGEVNMDFLAATFYKQGVQQSEEWNYVRIYMTEYLRQMVSASRHLSQKQNSSKPEEIKKVVKDLHEEYGVPYNEDDYPDTNKGQTQTGSKAPDVTISNAIKTVVKESELQLEEEGIINISYVVKEEAGNMVVPFDYIFFSGDEDDASELQVIVFKDHPLWKKQMNEEVKQILATSDAIYRMLVEKLEYDCSKALKIRNEWLVKRTESLRGR